MHKEVNRTNKSGAQARLCQRYEMGAFSFVSLLNKTKHVVKDHCTISNIDR